MAIITISRGTLSGGQALARCVADRLGYPCIGREELVDAGAWFGVATHDPTEAAGQPPEYWEQLHRERAAHIDRVRAGLCERAREGNLVYHGHAVHLLLPGISHVLRVRVIADMDFRVEAVMEDQKLTREEAVAYIQKADHERREWVRFLYGVEWDDPSLYDLVINLSHLSLDSACATVVFMARLDEFRMTAQSLKVVENLALRSRISAILGADPRIAGSELEVDADGGRVVVAGTARREVLDLLPSLVAPVPGVTGVRYEVTTPV